MHDCCLYELQFYTSSKSEESEIDYEESSIIVVASWLSMKKPSVRKDVFAEE